MRSKLFTIKVSKRFIQGLLRGAKKANEPSASEWIRSTMIREAKKYGVKIRR